MRRWLRIGLAAGAAAALGSCARPERAAEPVPAPPQQPVRSALPPPTPPPAAGWQDAPLSPGDWSYRSEGAASAASFGPPGQPVLVVRCEPSRAVTLARTGSGGAALIVRTSSAARSLPARSEAGLVAATLSASDPLLDAIVFSRGRFSVEAAGLPPLVVPAWPEAARVVEDCRS